MLIRKQQPRFTIFALVSVVTVLVIWLYHVNLEGMAHSGSPEKYRSTNNKRLTNSTNGCINTAVTLSPHEQLKENDSSSKQQPLQKQPKRTSDEEFEKRRRRINYVCSTGNVSGNVTYVMTHKKAGGIYCIVPKAGCTFWKRIFTAVNSKSNFTKESVSSLSREDIHKPDNQGIEYTSTDFNSTTFPTRLIVTRDPYSRLLSSYLDKIYLPGFWKWEVVDLAKKLPKHSSSNRSQDFLRNHFNKMAKIFQSKSNISQVTEAKNECGKYMTFSEFVESGLDRDEPHWMPIHKICNPCTFEATHISTMETFSADARAILSQMKLENIMDSLEGHAQIDQEIDSISLYNFHYFYRNQSITFYKPCLSPKEIAYRLWHNFRWRGYIDPDIDYKLPALTDLKDIEADFMVQVRAARKSGLQNPDKMKAAKNEFKKKVFLSISKSMFEKLSQKYAVDFELFGYTDKRDELYSLYSG